MKLISDTLHYREDGTVSGVTRVQREEFKTPSGRTQTEDVASDIKLEALTETLGGAAATAEARATELEELIAAERASVEADQVKPLLERIKALSAEKAELEAVLAKVQKAIAVFVEALK